VSRPPRVLRIITRVNVGGPATHVLVADRGLRELGWETRLVFGTVEPDEAEIDTAALDIPWQRVPSLGRAIRPVADARAAAAVARIIRSYRPDVIHTHLSKAGLIGRAVAMATSRAVRIHTFHGTVFGGYFGSQTSSAIIRAERRLGHHSQAVVALSERQRMELVEQRIAPPDRIRVVPLGLPLERFTPSRADGAREAARDRLGIPPDEFVVLAMGRLVPIKRLDRLIEAVAIAARDVPGIRAHLVGGGGEREQLAEQAARAGIGDRIAFDGWSSDSPSWYAAADVVALTSDREGTPLALIEAAASGRPVVATDVGGVADVVLEGQTGFVVPPDDVAALANRIVRLAGSADLRAGMGRRAPEHARLYDGSRLVTDLDELYRSTLLQSGRRS
jgi:glycosyltransferase involved in cell wall biosynthesis